MLGEIEMNKMYKFNKYLYIFVFTIISMFVFIIRFEYKKSFSLVGDNYLINFFNDFNSSIKDYDIIYISLLVFILYFYNDVYFNGNKYTKKNVIMTIVSFLISLFTVVGKSYMIDGTLRNIYMNDVQIFKSIIFLFGYWVIFYAILKKILSIKIDLKMIKKKDLS